MHLHEYLAEVSSIHLELTQLSRRQFDLMQTSEADRPMHFIHSLAHRQCQLHLRLTQLDALVQLELG